MSLLTALFVGIVILTSTLPRFVAALVRYSCRIHLSEETLKSLDGMVELFDKMGMVVNDIYSFNKELYLWNKDHKEGAKMLNIVIYMSNDAEVSYATAKRILWVLCREWEIDYQDMMTKAMQEKYGSNDDVKKYIKALEYVVGGNEFWSAKTERYHWRD